jgi:RNA polymerase sigma-70 factor (family 1)
MMETPDKNVFERFRNGDEKAFGLVYNHYREAVIRFCTSIVKDEQEAENLYHEVLIKIWRKRTAINPDRNFTYYLFTAVRNQVFDYLKEVKRNEALKERFWEKIVEYQEDNKEEKEEQLSRLESLVASLSPKRREIINLNFAEGKSYDEIADELSISKNTVKNQLVKAKQLLRKGLEGYFPLKT